LSIHFSRNADTGFYLLVNPQVVKERRLRISGDATHVYRILFACVNSNSSLKLRADRAIQEQLRPKSA
jgi:hypothetical protein